MKYWLKTKYRQIKRTLYFLPIIWKGRDFDYRYSLELFKHQLMRTAIFLESGECYSVDSLKTAKRIRTAVELLDKVYDEEYYMEYLDIVKDKYGDNAVGSFFERIPGGDGSHYLKYNYEYWDNAEEVGAFMKSEREKSQKKQRKAERLLWEFISHNIRYWWD